MFSIQKLFTLKYLKCPNCHKEPIYYYKLFWFMGAHKIYNCGNCNVSIKLDHYYVLEFFLYFFIMAILFNVIEYIYVINLSNWFTILVLLISFILMNFRERHLFKLKE